jgi:hypothetical protein
MSTKFHKGASGNKYGRPKGSKNRSTSEIKTAFQNLLDANVIQMESDLKKLSPKDRINVLLKLSEFVLPKMKNTESDLKETDNIIIIREV